MAKKKVDLTQDKTYDDSSTVRRVKYREEDEILEVEFVTGAVYHYFKVPVDVAIAALKSRGIGTFIAHQIKGSFEYKKVG